MSTKQVSTRCQPTHKHLTICFSVFNLDDGNGYLPRKGASAKVLGKVAVFQLLFLVEICQIKMLIN